MKPPIFEYFTPTSLGEATELLRQYGDEAKVLAGGQSLMPLLNMRLVRPKALVDINRIPGLDYISPTAGGGLAIGALARQRAVERSPLARERVPLLPEALPFVGHFQIRNRGTVGGSMAHADPAAELPALSVALGAEFVLAGDGRQRVVKAEDFFLTFLTTAIAPGELLTEVRFPALEGPWGWGFLEVCRREGDFALVGAVSLLQLDQGGACRGVRITMFGVGGTPLRLPRSEEAMLGRKVSSQNIKEAARLASEALAPASDIHASAEYRKEVGGVLVGRTLEAALARARGGSGR
jgi:CO/xanthine dehydrogenase FAD-binding subunit